MSTSIIPSTDYLYRRAVPDDYDFRRRKFSPGVYMLRDYKDEKELSVDWAAKRKSPEESAISNKKKYFVAGLLTQIPINEQLEVLYKPTKKNPAHSVIKGSRLTNSRQSNYDVAVTLAEESIPLVTSAS